jgi:polyisoprenoid-binding protein YceI
MRIIHRLLLAGAMVQACVAAEWVWQTDPASTKVNWTLGDVLHTVHGVFQLKRGSVTFDPESGKASGELVVDAASGDSGSGARDSRMKKNILEVQKYPDIVFAPDRVDGKVSPEGESDVKVHGQFTIHGASHELSIPAKVKAAGSTLDVIMNFTVPYVKWGMKNPSTLFLRVNDSVDIAIQAAGTLKHQ